MRTTLLLSILCILAIRFDAAAQQPSDSQKIILTYPVNGDTFTVGDTITVQWVCIDNIIAVDIRLSPDSRKTWILLNGSSIGYMDTGSWGHYKWVIPEKIRANPPDTTEFTLADNPNCFLRVENYSPHDKTEISVSPKPVTILARSGVIVPNRHAVQTPAFNLQAMLSQRASSMDGNATVRFFDVRGRAINLNRGIASGLIFGVFPSNEARLKSETEKAAFVRQR